MGHLHLITNFSLPDFEWVITVPAIWKARGKQMMREAAYLVRSLVLLILITINIIILQYNNVNSFIIVIISYFIEFSSCTACI